MGCAQPVGKAPDPTGDVVADQAHPFDAVDAAFGGFVGVPDLDRGAVDWLNVGVAAEDDDPVDGGDEVIGELFRGLVGDVDPDFEQDFCGQSVDRGSRVSCRRSRR